MTVECPKCRFENPDNTNFCGKCASPLDTECDSTDAPTATLDIKIPEFKTGSIIADRYEIIERLGKGGMGRVYKVHDLDVGEKIALKLIRSEIAANTQIIARFQNELRLARRISHRNVCRMFDLSRDGDMKFITMEYVSGEDLKTTIKRMGPLTARKTVSIAKQICQGLSEAHRLGVIHRDLKSRNIMIDREGSVRIMDFGIALAPDSEGLTESGAIVGTPQYLSPEQIDGKKLDSRTDIYALGIIMYEMATGKVPFVGDSTYNIAFKQKMEAPQAPWDINPEIPLELGRLILKCLAKDSEHRPQTAEEVSEELTRLEEGSTSMERTSRLKLLLETSKIRIKSSRYPGVLLLIMLVAVLGYFGIRQFIPSKAAESELSPAPVSSWTNSVIVLPFRIDRADPLPENLRQTVSDRIIRNLSRFKELRTINSWTSWSYRNSDLPPKDIANRNNANHVLMGTLTQQGGLLRIETELLSAQGDHILWSESYECPLDSGSVSTADLYGILDLIASATASNLGLEMVESRYPRIKPTDTVELAAIEFYRKGKGYENRFYETEEIEYFEECIRNFQQAIDIDPDYALVLWRMGVVHEVKHVITKEEQDKSLMYKYFQDAYDVDPDLAEANVGMGWMYFYHEDHEEAYTYFKNGYHLDPNNAEVNYHLGSFLRSLGLYEQALEFYTRALALDPIPQDFVERNRMVADCYVHLGRLDEAVDFLREVISSRPDPLFHLHLAECLIKMGDYSEAEKELAAAVESSADPGVGRAREVLLLALTGEQVKARRLFQNLTPRWANSPRVASMLAVLGEQEESIRRIREGHADQFVHQQWYPYSYLLLKNNPFFDVLRDDPDFEEILREERELYQERLRKFGGL